MIWFVLAVLFLGWHLLLLIGKVWGTDGVMVAMLLGLAVLSVMLFGGLASIAFSLTLPLAGWGFVAVLTMLLGYLVWTTWDGLC